MQTQIEELTSKRNRLRAITREVTAEVLDTMFFAEAEPIESDCRPEAGVSAEDAISAHLRFQGVPSGDLRVALSRDFSRSLAAGFLGVDIEEVPPGAETQTCCELANMICGAILSRVHPDSRVALATPEIAPVDLDERGGLRQCFLTPDGPLCVILRFED